MNLNLSPQPLQYTFMKNGKTKLPTGLKQLKWFDTPHRMFFTIIDGARSEIKYTKFNPGSRTHITTWLKKYYNWIPKSFTSKGNVKVSYETLEGLSHIPEANMLKDYLKLSKDHSQLSTGMGSLLNSYNPDTHCIHHRCDGMGTNTGRMAHSSPNVSQVPAQKEFRELFSCPKDYSIVGADLSGQELRVLAHFIYPYDNGAYAKAVLEGNKENGTDIHTMNMKAAELDTRDEAKTLIYAILYGASATKIGVNLIKEDTIVEYTSQEFSKMKTKVEKRVINLDGELFFPISKDELMPYTDRLIESAIFGERIYNKFIDKTVGYKDLKDKYTKYADTHGYIIGVDGRRLTVRSSHSVLNLLFQGTAAVVSKQWNINAEEMFKAKYNKGYMKDFWQNAVIHDEIQYSVKNELILEFKPLLEQAATFISKQLNLNVPMAAEAASGQSWYDCH